MVTNWVYERSNKNACTLSILVVYLHEKTEGSSKEQGNTSGTEVLFYSRHKKVLVTKGLLSDDGPL
jgi:hypothetical protein